jgi:hypothetical protein
MQTGASKGSWWASYEFPTPAGRRTGIRAFQSMIVVEDFGIRPESGDRPMPRWLFHVLVAATVATALAATFSIVRALAR